MNKIEQSQAIAKVVTDIRRSLAIPPRQGESVYPLKLRITHNRKRKYYSIPLEGLTKSELKRIETGNRLSKGQREILEEIQIIESKAARVIKEIGHFNFDRFKKFFFVDHSQDKNDVYSAFESYIKDLRKQGRESTAVSYNCALNSLKSFRSSLLFSETTPAFLESYEKAMAKQDKSQNTIGIYLRSLRTIINKAKGDGLISNDQYPFGKPNAGKYQIPASENVKKALTKEEIQKIKDFIPRTGSRAEKAKDFWLFAYYTNGLNIKDIAYLKFENLDLEAGMVRFKRKKTERTNKGRAKEITAPLTEFAQAVINKYSTNSGDPDEFIFPVLEEKLKPEEIYQRIQDFTKTINKGMKDIASTLGINKRVTTYSARHSHATILLKNGAPLAMISQNLGHSSIKTTQNYLDSFDDQSKKEMAALL